MCNKNKDTASMVPFYSHCSLIMSLTPKMPEWIPNGLRISQRYSAGPEVQKARFDVLELRVRVAVKPKLPQPRATQHSPRVVLLSGEKKTTPHHHHTTKGVHANLVYAITDQIYVKFD